MEDLDRGIAEERVLLHLLNLAREHKLSILLTSRLAAGELDVGLPDLRSRLRALPLVRIESPDEALLQGVLVKLPADRQLDVEPHVVSFLARRMERSMAAATRTVAEVDRLALALAAQGDACRRRRRARRERGGRGGPLSRGIWSALWPASVSYAAPRTSPASSA